MKTRTTCATIALTFGLAAASHAAVIQPNTVNGNITGDAGSSLANLINNSGLSTSLTTGISLATAQATTHVLSGTGHTDSWTRPTSVGNPEFWFDLGADKNFGTLLMWQYGNNGGGPNNMGNATRDFEVIFHTAAEGSSFLPAESVEYNGTMDYITTGNTTADNVAQTFQFASVTARFVLLRIVNNWGGQINPSNGATIQGGDRYGLGEVRFAEETAPVPEPSSTALLGLGGLALILRRRK